MEAYQNAMFQNIINRARRENDNYVNQANNHYVNPLRAIERARTRARGRAGGHAQEYVPTPTPQQIQQELRMLGFASQGCYSYAQLIRYYMRGNYSFIKF